MTVTGKLLLAACAGLLGLSLYIHWTIAFWGDQDWELLVAHMLLSGKQLYLDQFAVNPPLIFWLYTLPVFIALHVKGLQDYQALVILTAGVCALATWVCVRLIAFHPGFADSQSRRVQFVVLLGFLFIFRIASPFFGDREHLFLVLTFPYLLRWLPSISSAPLSGRLRTLIGLLAGVGFCMKPHCLLVFAGIQFVCLIRRDRPSILLSLENVIIYGIFTIYMLAVALITPDYFSTVLPIAWLTYSAISASPAARFDYTILVTLFLTFVMFRPGRNSPYRRDIYYLLLVSLFLLGYGLINGGWGYTYQPVLTLLLFINGFVLWEFAWLKSWAGRSAPVWPFIAGEAACLLNFITKTGIVLAYFAVVLSHPCRGDEKCIGYYTPYVSEVAASGKPQSFGTIGMNFALWPRVARLSGAEWVTRFPQLWMIPKFIISGQGFALQHQWILAFVADALASDLDQHRPELLFVDASDLIYTIKLQKPFDWVGAFSGYDSFKAAFSHYAFVHTVDSCDGLIPAQAAGYMMERRRPAHASDCRYDVYRRLP